MKDALYVAGYALLIVFGLPITRVPFVARLDRAARLAVAFAVGALVVAMLMFVETVLHVSWTRVTLGVPLVAIAGWSWARRARRRGGASLGEGDVTFIITFAVVLLITIYGVLTARETCADLFLFWGPKAQRFHLTGKIDIPFLAFPHYSLMHPDYPPLVTTMYAWCALVAHRFSWWGSLLSLPVAIAAAVLAFRGIARDAIGALAANRYAMLMTTLLAATFAISMTAGGADPMLVVFELIAITSLTFAPDDRGAQLVAALALAGAALTKVEGAAFVAVTLAAYVVTRRRVIAPLLMALPAAILLGSWIAFARKNQLIESYRIGGNPLHLPILGTVIANVLRKVSYGVYWLPWIATLVPIVTGRNWRRAALPLLVAAGAFAYTIFFYLHIEDPTWWIDSSADRVLITALMCLGVAAAASEPAQRLVTAAASE